MLLLISPAKSFDFESPAHTLSTSEPDFVQESSRLIKKIGTFSRKKIAELMEEHLGLGKFELVQDNIRLAEGQESQGLAAQTQENVVDQIADRQTIDDDAEEAEV